MNTAAAFKPSYRQPQKILVFYVQQQGAVSESGGRRVFIQ